MKKNQSPNSPLKKVNLRFSKNPAQKNLYKVIHPILTGVQKANPHVDQAGAENSPDM
jgi:hypothetical protein